MNVETLHFSVGTGPVYKALLTSLIVDASSPDKLIESAVYSQGLNVELFQGIDDDRPELALVGIKFSRSRTEFGEIYLEKAAFFHEKSRDLSGFILGIDPNNQIELDDRAFDSWEDELGFSFSNALCAPVGTKDALIPYIYTFACSDGGEVIISPNALPHDDDYEDMRADLELEGLSRENLILLSFHYNTPKSAHALRPGFGSYRYILKAEEHSGSPDWQQTSRM